jgi:hypothetical protein
MRRNATSAEFSGSNRFQFKSFFVQTPAIPLMTMELLDSTKYLAGR